jgi:XTP/dITP diphosphohydrolase
MRLIIATRNLHKTGEIRAILGEHFEYVTLRDLPSAPEALEDAETFEGNATKKAAVLAHWLIQERKANNGFVLADDSGLEVDALNGAPGVHSARFAALDNPNTPPDKNSSDQENNAKLLRLLANVLAEKRTARFRCMIALVPLEADASLSIEAIAKSARIFQGKCEGRLAFAPKGTGGFGYDPLFIPNGYTQSFAELGEDVKNKLSHRAKALEELQNYLTKRA